MEQFRQISVTDLERYLEYLKYRPDDPDHRNTNKEQGIKRKFFSLKSFFGYFHRTGQITVNPTLSMQVPKIREKEIVRLNQKEIKELLKEAESGAGGIAEGCGGQEASGVRTGDDRSGGNRAGGHQPQFFLQI